MLLLLLLLLLRLQLLLLRGLTLLYLRLRGFTTWYVYFIYLQALVSCWSVTVRSSNLFSNIHVEMEPLLNSFSK
jgi:hypothetical protein